jgi:hypothetical protein
MWMYAPTVKHHSKCTVYHDESQAMIVLDLVVARKTIALACQMVEQ